MKQLLLVSFCCAISLLLLGQKACSPPHAQGFIPLPEPVPRPTVATVLVCGSGTAGRALCSPFSSLCLVATDYTDWHLTVPTRTLRLSLRDSRSRSSTKLPADSLSQHLAKHRAANPQA